MYVFNHFLPEDRLRELVFCNTFEELRERVFFNTFEELNLPIKGPMEDAEVVKLNEPSQTA